MSITIDSDGMTQRGTQECAAHCWTFTYDNGPWQHCDDCGADHPNNPALPFANNAPARPYSVMLADSILFSMEMTARSDALVEEVGEPDEALLADPPETHDERMAWYDEPSGS